MFITVTWLHVYSWPSSLSWDEPSNWLEIDALNLQWNRHSNRSIYVRPKGGTERAISVSLRVWTLGPGICCNDGSKQELHNSTFSTMSFVI